MTRRTILDDRNNRSVKWSLLAAAIALSAGLFAEFTIRSNEEPPAVVQEIEHAPAERS